MDMKFGSSPGSCRNRREVLDICRHAGHLKTEGVHAFPGKCFAGEVPCTWRKKDREIFMVSVAISQFVLNNS